MALARVLKHRAYVVGRAIESDDEDDYVEGDSELEPENGPTFKCCLFLDLSSETEAGTKRRRGPQLLVGPKDIDGRVVDLLPTDRVAIIAPELAIGEEVIWQIAGDPQPFGKPGRTIKGKLLALKRIEDREDRVGG